MAKITKETIQDIHRGLFDDDIFSDIFGHSDEEQSREAADDIVNELYIDTLCVQDRYFPLTPDASRNIPLYKDDIKNSIIYVAPWRNYKSYGVDGRKKKAYTDAFFYRYAIDYSDQDNVKLYVSKLTKDSNTTLVINQQMCKFFETYYNIYRKTVKEVIFRVPGNSLTETITIPFDKIYVFAPKYTHSFVKTFPKKITPGGSDACKNETNPISEHCLKLNKKQFESLDDFKEFVTIMVNNNFTVFDEKANIYNQSTIDNNVETNTEHDEKQTKEYKFLVEQLGQPVIDKFEKVLNTITANNNGKTVYLKTLNTFRNVKLNLVNTVWKLIDANYKTPIVTFAYSTDPGIKQPLLSGDTDREHIYLKNYGEYMLCAMYYALIKAGMNDWKAKYKMRDFLYGYDDEYGYGYSVGYGEKYLDLNDLPIKFFNVSSIYKLYFAIAAGLQYCEPICDKICNHYDDNINDTEMDNLLMNVTMPDMNSFDFTVLNEQITEIINKQCKKLKIK